MGTDDPMPPAEGPFEAGASNPPPRPGSRDPVRGPSLHHYDRRHFADQEGMGCLWVAVIVGAFGYVAWRAWHG